MFGDDCLEFKHEGGRACGNQGRTTLRTSLAVNNLQPPPFLKNQRLPQSQGQSVAKAEVDWDSCWLPEIRNSGAPRVWLGKHGTLSMLRVLDDNTLPVDWRGSPITLGFEKLMRKVAPAHRSRSVWGTGETTSKFCACRRGLADNHGLLCSECENGQENELPLMFGRAALTSDIRMKSGNITDHFSHRVWISRMVFLPARFKCI